MRPIYNYIYISMQRCNRFIFASLAMILFLGVYSCERDEVFEREQYKNVFALISGSDNVSSKYHQLGEESVGYVAVSMGGTNPTNKDIHVRLVEDLSLIDNFNRINFDADVSKYVRPLPPSKYDIDNYDFTIPSGEINARLPVRIRPDGLSPDSSYFVALKVDNFSSHEVNPDKSYVLYRVQTKNEWAEAGGNTVYSMRSKLGTYGSTSYLEIPGSKIMQPITKNSVRIMAGNETYSPSVTVFNRAAITLEINEETNEVTINPYKDIEIIQMSGDPDYPNIFKIENDGFKTYKTFLLHYLYRIGGSAGTIYEVKEELRLEYN